MIQYLVMSDAGKMITSAIESIRRDGRLDAGELDEVVRIALADGTLDSEEKRALKDIIFALDSTDLIPRLCARVEALVKQFSLDK